MTTAAISRTAGGAAMLLAGLCATAAEACVVVDTQGPFNRALATGLHNLIDNKRVKQGPDCSFVNGGKDDLISGDAAMDLGQGRIAQLFGGPRHLDELLVVVCAEHEAVVLYGVTVKLAEPEGGPCDGEITDRQELTAYLPGTGKFDYHAGKDFAGFKAYMDKFGMDHHEDLELAYDWSQSRDKVNLLCGCQVFYPETMN